MPVVQVWCPTCEAEVVASVHDRGHHTARCPWCETVIAIPREPRADVIDDPALD